MQFDGGSIQQLYQIRKQQDAAYWRQVEEIVAGRLRSLRVAEERAAAAKAGHPVKLPTGACQVIATIQADGTVARSQLGQCSHQSIGDDMLKAVQQASPLPPYGRPVNMPSPSTPMCPSPASTASEPQVFPGMGSVESKTIGGRT